MATPFKDLLRLVEKTIGADGVKVVYDVGSGNAEETVEMSKIFPNARFYAFECNPACIANCASRVVNNERITLFPVCIYSYDGTIDFHPINQQKTITTHEDGNPRASSVYVANGTYPHETYVQDTLKIPCMTLDTAIQTFGLPEPQIMWMDMQGAELDALRGFTKTSDLKIIHTEATNKEMYTGQGMWPELKEYIETVLKFDCIAKPTCDGWIWDDFDFVKRGLIRG